MSFQKLNVVLLTNNDHQAPHVGFELSKNNWDVEVAWNAQECNQYLKAMNVDAIAVFLDNPDIIDTDFLAQITPYYPVIIIDQLPMNKENRDLVSNFVEQGAYHLLFDNIEDDLKRVTLNSVLYYRSGELAAA